LQVPTGFDIAFGKWPEVARVRATSKPDGGSAVRDLARTGVPAPTVRRIKSELVGVFVVALAVGAPLLWQVPFTDELTHVLAARSLLEDGSMSILPGGDPYGRAAAFTTLIAGLFRVFGESVAVGRLPALLFGSLLATLLFSWVYSQVGRIGAWFAAMLLVLSLPWLQLSLWVRGYTLHALLFLAACVLAHFALSSSRLRPARDLALAIAVLVILLGIQPLTGTGSVIVSAAGLGLWVLAIGLPRLFRYLPSRRHRFLAGAALSAFALICAVGIFQIGLVDQLIDQATNTDLWGEADRNNYLYHHDWIMQQYPALWPLFPVAALVATIARPRAAMLCLCVFVVAFVAHSIAAAKADRYIFHAWPMFFAIWGLAVGAGFPWAREWLARRFKFFGEPSGYRLVNAVGVLFMAVMALYPAVVRPALVYAMTAEARNPQWRGYGRVHLHPDWRAAGLALQPMVQQAEVVLGTDEVAGYHGLDRLDYLFRRTYSTRQGELEEFELHRGAIPVVSNAESLDRLIACNATGLVFVERQYLRRDWTGIPQMMDHLETRLARLAVPEEWGFVVFHWERAEPVAAPTDCALPRLGPTGPSVPRS